MARKCSDHFKSFIGDGESVIVEACFDVDADRKISVTSMDVFDMDGFRVDPTDAERERFIEVLSDRFYF